MGARFLATRIAGDSATVREEFERMQADDAFSNGHEYSGGWNMATGIKFLDVSFADEDEAYEWLADRAQKWEEAIAVRLSQTVTTKRTRDIRERLRAVEQDLSDLPQAIARRIQRQKSKLRTCPDCESRIAVHMARTDQCPVCNSEAFAWTATDAKTKERLQQKTARLRKQLREIGEGQANKDGEWYVGAWAAS